MIDVDDLKRIHIVIARAQHACQPVAIPTNNTKAVTTEIVTALLYHKADTLMYERLPLVKGAVIRYICRVTEGLRNCLSGASI